MDVNLSARQSYTSQLNRVLQTAQDRHQMSSGTGKPLRIYYGTQVKVDPPTFLLYVNNPKLGISAIYAS